MNFTGKFPALLKNSDGQVIERGSASVSLENRSVNFSADFVPMFKLGQELSVVRVWDDREIHSFTGQVYISNRDFVQITGVCDQVIEPVGLIHSANASVLGEVLPLSSGGVKDRRFTMRLRRKLPVALPPSDVLLYALTPDTMRFTSTATFQKGQRLTLKTGEPLFLSNVVIEVYQVILFGNRITGYHCNILSISESEIAALEQYAWDASQKSRKLF